MPDKTERERLLRRFTDIQHLLDVDEIEQQELLAKLAALRDRKLELLEEQAEIEERLREE